MYTFFNERGAFCQELLTTEHCGGLRFTPEDPLTIARAPGRLDVMGGVADYSGSLVAETTIGEAATVALQRRGDNLLRIASREAERDEHAPLVTLSFSELARDATGVRKRLIADPASRWALYVAGCFIVLLAEKYLSPTDRGAEILISSDVPMGGGVSSSAALEVATMMAVNAAYGAGVPEDQIAILAQRVENVVVGAPCGVMDQMAVAHGHEGALMLLLCRPAEITGYQPLPEGVQVWGINSAVKHSVAASPYTKARVGAFMGRRIVNGHLQAQGQAMIANLCELTPSRYRRDFSPLIPSSIDGADFLGRYGETGDTATTVVPTERYSVRAAAEHAIYENHRVGQFITHLADATRSTSPTRRAMSLIRAGELMYASHWSYTRINLGSRETNLLVKLARDLGPSRGVFGAKITGGGSGGTVALLTEGDEGSGAVEEIAARYAEATGLTPYIFRGGASPGAIEFGTLTTTVIAPEAVAA
jgi:galactokinase